MYSQPQGYLDRQQIVPVRVRYDYWINLEFRVVLDILNPIAEVMISRPTASNDDPVVLRLAYRSISVPSAAAMETGVGATRIQDREHRVYGDPSQQQDLVLRCSSGTGSPSAAVVSVGQDNPFWHLDLECWTDWRRETGHRKCPPSSATMISSSSPPVRQSGLEPKADAHL